MVDLPGEPYFVSSAAARRSKSASLATRVRNCSSVLKAAERNARKQSSATLAPITCARLQRLCHVSLGEARGALERLTACAQQDLVFGAGPEAPRRHGRELRLRAG